MDGRHPTPTTRSTARSTTGLVRRSLAAAAAALAIGLAATAPATATTATADAAATGSRHDHRVQVVVMTRNLYLGSSLAPALTATDTASFLGAVARIYATAQRNDFATRAEGIADEIAAGRPDLVGLQEVSRWETAGPGVPPTVDFLDLLSAALAARELHYAVASVSANADLGPLPLAQPCASTVIGACTVTLKDRDVVLVDTDRAGLRWHTPRSGSYVAQQTFTPPIPGAAAVSFRRGWASIDGRLRGARFHFVTTHLETENFPAVQQSQAAEFLAGPARGPGADIATGDFNSAADGSTTTTYALLTDRFRDAWSVNPDDPGLTCCRPPTLDDPASTLRSRIDLVLTRGDARALSATVVGTAPFRATPPLWPSDHAGVVATLRLDD